MVASVPGSSHPPSGELMCVFCGSPEPLHLGWVPLAIGAYAYYKGKQAIRRTEDAERARQVEPESAGACASPPRPPAPPMLRVIRVMQNEGGKTEGARAM